VPGEERGLDEVHRHGRGRELRRVDLLACLYEMLAGRRVRTRSRALAGGALTSAVAYVTDYHVVPRRLTPGFEMRLSRAALAAVYVALALGLCARDLFTSGEARSP
jgi:hypothetical protein